MHLKHIHGTICRLQRNTGWEPLSRTLYIATPTCTLGQCFSICGSRPTFGSRVFTFGSPKTVYSIILILFGSPNCVLFCFVGLQIPDVENHCFKNKLFDTLFHMAVTSFMDDPLNYSLKESLLHLKLFLSQKLLSFSKNKQSDFLCLEACLVWKKKLWDLFSSFSCPLYFLKFSMLCFSFDQKMLVKFCIFNVCLKLKLRKKTWNIFPKCFYKFK